MKRIVVGLSGASGIPLAIKLLEELKKYDCEIHLVVSKGALMTLGYESDKTEADLKNMCDYYYDNEFIGASIASGTFKNEGMIIIPCSMKTVAGIAHGYSDSLILRAADVMIKEKRNLVLVTRESPLSSIHLDNLAYLSKIANITILPPMMTYYHQPKTIEDMENHIIGKISNVFDIEMKEFKRWK